MECTDTVIKPVKQSLHRSWQSLSCLLCNLQFYCLSHHRKPLGPYLSRMNSVRPTKSDFF